MSLWLVKRPDGRVGYDEFDAFVVRASTPDQAKAWAATKAADEGREAWLAADVIVEAVLSKGKDGIILGSFNAG